MPNLPCFPITSASDQSPEQSWAPQWGSIDVLVSGWDNRDMKETETKRIRSFVMQSWGFGALQLKKAAAPTHW